MRRFRNIWFALAAFFWLPANAHCQLEFLTGLEFFKCAEIAPAAHASAQDCTDCCAVEKSQFRTELSRTAIPLPDLFSVLHALLPIPDETQPPEVRLDLTSAPPDLSQRWHFLARLALPGRAPSSIS